jgi:hypothetical protein
MTRPACQAAETRENRADPRVGALARALHSGSSVPNANNELRRITMTTSTKTSTMKTGLSIKTSIKAGGLTTINHSRAGLAVRSAVKAGGLTTINHNRALLSVR